MLNTCAYTLLAQAIQGSNLYPDCISKRNLKMPDKSPWPFSAYRGELVAGTSRKFWEVVQRYNQTTVTFGKIGGPAKSDVKDHPSDQKASQFALHMINSKQKKGYVLVHPSQTSKKGATSAMSITAKAKLKSKVIKKHVVKVKAKVAAGPGSRRSLCFTGALPIKRSVAAAAAKNAGFVVTSGVNKKTNILVVGDGAGGKAVKQGAPGMEHWPWSKFKRSAGL